jgi:antitoxin component of MazEF toxin-antitoxin module
MRTTIVAIGNSKGIRLPKVLLEESGISKNVEVKVIRGGLRITPIANNKNIANETMRLSEKILSKDWSRPEEDKAWANL